ncbi:YSC84-related protein [Aquabacterium sp. CECT 9606]|uniref:YSC84-related protein n=1 Tax=Aquabacterium sp. CECT 9606 TaxID=2845822 RepID=UPI001E2D01E8|nr:YSC84-related protein [Aquabacterium sp. CECT 9606]
MLNSSKALNHFMKPSAFSLNADAGLTIVNWSVASSDAVGDIVAWSSNSGLFGNAAAVGVSNLRFSKNQTNAFYGQKTGLDELLAGRVKAGKADALRQALTTAAR